MISQRATTGGETALADNRKARHLYTITETLEAGISLLGSEVRSLRVNRASLSEAFVIASPRSLALHNLSIASYRNTPPSLQHPLRRVRPLLIHSRELKRLSGKARERGMTIVPLKLYTNQRGKIKVLIGLAKGKTTYDRRESEKRKDWERQKQRLLRHDFSS